MYFTQQLSQRQIGEKLGVHKNVIQKLFKKLGIQARDKDRQTIRINQFTFKTQEIEAFNGMMLGDGGIVLPKKDSKKTARFCYKSIFKETLEDVVKHLPSIDFGPINGPYQNCYGLQSHNYGTWMELYNKWYPQRIKIVPKDIQLTPLACYWWVIGDGAATGYGFRLCTQCFDDESLDFLIDQLSLLDFKANIDGDRTIRICSEPSVRFLKMIEDNCVIASQYRYKWYNNYPKRKENNPYAKSVN